MGWWKKTKKNPFVKAGLFGGGLTAATLLSGGTLPIAAGIGLAGAGIYQQYKNYAEQSKQNDRQWKSYQEQLQREDNSTFRRVQDLRAAGLSPVLAAGSGASSQAVFTGKSPQMENPIQPIADVMALLKMKEDISNTVSQRDYISQQIRKAKADARVSEHDAKVFESEAYKNLPSNIGGLVGQFAALLNAGEWNKFPGQLKGAFIEVKDKLNNPFNLPQFNVESILRNYTPEQIRQVSPELYNKLKQEGKIK